MASTNNATAGYTWIPSPELPLLISQEHETDLRAVVQVVPTPPPEGREGNGENGSGSGGTPATPVATLLWRMPAGHPDNIQVHTQGNTLTLDVQNWAGLFPVKIHFMKDAEPVQTPEEVTRWQDLPAKQSDVYAYIPDDRNIRHFKLEIEAYGSSGQLLTTQTYTLTVYANYSLGKEELQAAVNQRKETIT